LEIIPAGSFFPLLEMDRQLLRYIFRCAISNACKHGKKDGVVSTKVRFDTNLHLFSLQIINLPGIGHDKLCKLSASEASKVFDQNSNLISRQEGTTEDKSGNGGWIMKKVRINTAGSINSHYKNHSCDHVAIFSVLML
jgi:hypothetical protein